MPPETAQAFDRQEMILQYYPLVKTVAYKLVTRFPPNVELDDLINVGCLGLIDAIDRFTPDRATSFRSYAEMRIRGAMIDELRSMDWVPRSMRQRMDDVDKARRQLELDLGRDPSETETARYLGMELEQYQGLTRNSALLSTISIEEVGNPEDGRRDAHNAFKDTNQADAETLLEHQKEQERLADAISKLNEREKYVIALYYNEDLTLKEIGEVLGVTESRVSQIHTQAIKRLQLKLR